MNVGLNLTPDTLEAAKQAATEIFSGSNVAFEEIKNRPWYKSLLNAITFQRGDKKMIVQNVRNLASLQTLYMEVYTNHLKNQDAELEALIKQVLSTQQFAYKMYLSCMLRLKPQKDISALAETDQQILLLFLGEFNRMGCLDTDNLDRLRQYNLGVATRLNTQRPDGILTHEQLEGVQSPDVFYRCALEQCAVTSRLEPLYMPSNIADAIRWLDISEQKKERILSAVQTELDDYGYMYFLEKYRATQPAIDENSIEFTEENIELAEHSIKVLDEKKMGLNGWNKILFQSPKDTAPITQKVTRWLDINSFIYDFVYFTKWPKHQDPDAIIACYNLKDYKQLPVKRTYRETVFDQFGCFIGRHTYGIDMVYDEKYNLDIDNRREDFLKLFLTVCQDIASIDPVIEASRRLLHSIERQSVATESGERFEKFFDGAKKGITGIRDEMEQKIVGEEKDNLLRKTGGSIFGMLSAVPTSLIAVGLDAGKAMAKGTESASTGAMGAVQAKAFDIKYRKTIQQNILAAKMVEYLDTLVGE